MALEVLVRFNTRSEADLAAAALRAADVPAVAFDDAAGGSPYRLPFSADGFRVLVPAEYKTKALAELERLRAAAREGDQS